jgi:membrane protease YdiL (CAAX protease family)
MIKQLPKSNSNALKFAIIVGSFLFTLNHGSAVAKNEMTVHRWFSATLGYVIPLLTSIYCPCAKGSSASKTIPTTTLEG